MDAAKSDYLRKESAAAHSRWMGAMRVQNVLTDHLSPAAKRELDKLLQVLLDDYNAASKANIDYHSAALNTAADQAEGSLFVVAAIHEGSTALAA